VSTEEIYPLLVLYGTGNIKPILSLPSFSSIGSYTLVYYTEGWDCLCAECATTELINWMHGHDSNPPYHYDTYDEGPPVHCEECGKEMESSYGDPVKPCVIRETMSGFICAECGDDCECVVCANQGSEEGE
jgi:hypothetical protein